MSRTLFNRSGLMAATAMALALTACNKSGTSDNGATATNQSAQANGALPALPAAVPLQQGDATPIATAPAAQALPAAAPVRVAQVAQPADAYAYLDRAAGVSDAIGNAPPDYAYDDGNVSPWAWQTGDGDVQYAEPVEGGYRYYYYEPGADTPYLVRDPSYSYGYSDGQLVAVYDQRGALLPPDAYRERADYASRYYARAAYLHGLAQQREHRGVVAANWAARRAEISAAQAQWSENRAQQAEWQAYHQAHANEEQDHWAAERQQRQAEADRFNHWQSIGFHNPPPAPVALPPRQQRPVGYGDNQRADDMRHQQQIAQQQAQQQADRNRHEADQRAAQDHQQQVQQHARQAEVQHQQDQQAEAQRAQAHDHALQQQVNAQHLAAQHADVERQQHAQAEAQQAHARAAEQQAQRSQALAEQQQRAQAEAQQVHARAAEQQAQRSQAQAAAHRQQAEAHAAQAHAQAAQAHEQAAQHAAAQERAHASAAPAPHAPAPHPPAPHRPEPPHHPE